MRVLIEKLHIKDSYTIDELKNLEGTFEKVSAVVVKVRPDKLLELDLGNDIKGVMSLEDFEDSSNLSLTSVVSKIGKIIYCIVDSVDIDKNEVVLNRRKLQIYYKKNVLDKLQVGTILEAQVLSVASFGVFVDLGVGIIGMLPLADISITRIVNPKDIFKVGDSITVVYKGLVEKGYLVTHKELLGTWKENLQEYNVGDYFQGVIREIKPYGLFIEITPNLSGLADYPEDVDVHLGDTVCVYLKSINEEKLKVKLQIISVSSTPYKVKYKYLITEEVIKEWVYTPSNCIKEIKTVF